MIYTYGITQQGTYHVKNDLVCQDAHNIIKCSDSYAIAAVADGLGSEEHSDTASKLAAKVSTEYCAERIKDDATDEQILEIIRDSFALAQSRIEQTANENGHDLDQYDTTLSLAVFRRDRLYYGQSGDSGIVALTADGLYKKVTEQQRDAEGRVFPLYFGDEKWVFGKFPETVVSVFLATDGMLETLFPVYIRNEPVDIYVALARYFMGPDSLHIEEAGEECVREKVAGFMSRIPDAQVNDDKTVVVLVDPDAEMKEQAPEYYAEPDWNELKRRYQEAWRRAAYPHLFKDKGDTKDEAQNAAETDENAGAKQQSEASEQNVPPADAPEAAAGTLQQGREESTMESAEGGDGAEEAAEGKIMEKAEEEPDGHCRGLGRGILRGLFSKKRRNRH